MTTYLSPADFNLRLRTLRDDGHRITQSFIAKVLERDQSKVNKFLRGDEKALNSDRLVEFNALLALCERLARRYPVPMNFDSLERMEAAAARCEVEQQFSAALS